MQKLNTENASFPPDNALSLIKKHITLVLCPCWGVQMPYLGLAHLCTYLKSLGAVVHGLDLNIDVYRQVSEKAGHLWENTNADNWVDPQKMKRYYAAELLHQVDYCVEKILRTPAPIIGFSIYRSNRLFSIKVIDAVKKADPSRTIIVGGRGCATPSERALFNQKQIDAFATGAGETVLAEGIRRNGDFSGIPGTIIPKNNRLPEAKPIPVDINAIPFPTFEEFDLSLYTDKTLPIMTSTGCIGRCAFCDDHLAAGRYRYRKAENILQELKWHVSKNKISHFWFNDLLVNGNQKNLERLCDLIIADKLKIRWIALAMIRRDTTLTLLRKMRKAGCYTLNYGVESGADSILKKMGALYTVADTEQVLKFTRQAGINTQLNFIFGFPGETENEFLETLAFIQRNRIHICGVTNINTCAIVENSPLGNNPSAYDAYPRFRWKPVDKRFSTKDGTDYQERVDRVKRAITTLKKLGLPIWTTNIPAPGSIVETRWDAVKRRTLNALVYPVRYARYRFGRS